jgi:hypothetical protein
MSEFKRPLDYIDVAARLTDMREKFPDLTMQQVSMEFVSIGNKDFVVYTAAAYRNAEDTRPGIGTAWEPIPGPTPFTRDSEVQNAETAAWGRALIAIGASTKNGIASAEEVSNRSGEAPDREAQYRRPPIEVQTPSGLEEDARIAVILRAAETGENDFLNDLAKKYTQYGNLTENQLAAGFKAAHKILGEA